MYRLYILFLFLGSLGSSWACSNYFSYENDGQQYYGYLQIPPPSPGTELRLELHMSVDGRLPDPNYPGTITIHGSPTEIAQDVANGRTLRYTVAFPVQSPLPKPTSVIYNGQTICNGQSPSSTSTRIKLFHVLKTPSVAGGAQSQFTPQLNPFSNNVPTPENPQQTDYQTFEYDFENVQAEYPVQQQTTKRPIQQLQHKPTQRPIIQQRPIQARPPVQRPPQTQRPQYASEPSYAVTTTTEKPVQTQSSQYDPDNQDDSIVCGIPVPFGSQLAVGGKEIKRGEFPWIVAITKSDFKYHCGGSLISKDHVLTAAHCVTDSSGDELSPNELLLHLGRANLESYPAEGYQIVKPRKIISHAQYEFRKTATEYDIAVILLKRKIRYNAYIRPICIWRGTPDFSRIVDQRGIVVGWGSDHTGKTTSVANRVSMRVVSKETCYNSHREFEVLLTTGTFCAGERDGTGPCNGDSGCGLAIKSDDKYYIRGVVSSSLSNPETRLCDLSNYIIFTDVSSNRNWLREYVQ